MQRLLVIPDIVAYAFESMPEMLRISAEQNYPVISYGHPSFEAGAVLTMFPSLFEVVNAAGLGEKIFQGNTPEELPIIYVKYPEIKKSKSIGMSPNQWGSR